ncbi:MAG: enoyl-CoA hydratase/isomerase family protein, partial [candidate division Zixibacteria bacterium]|nr:enoyl-CoA hydratase/isomerase family protein [candidate division Zixibacteria bacterium]
MSFVNVFKRGEIAIVTISRGKVNAFNGEVVDELRAAFEQLEKDSATKAVILSGSGKFFSYGFDVPEFCDYSREQFEKFLVNFTEFCAYLFPYPKPIIAAINGHATAGGCILAMLCD